MDVDSEERGHGHMVDSWREESGQVHFILVRHDTWHAAVCRSEPAAQRGDSRLLSPPRADRKPLKGGGDEKHTGWFAGTLLQPHTSLHAKREGWERVEG